MVETAERYTSAYAYASHTYSGAIVDVPVFSWTSSISSCEPPSTTATIGLLTRDPIGYEGSPYGLYEFLRSSATDLTDPTGLATVDCNCKCGGQSVPKPTECAGNSKIEIHACCRQSCDMTQSFCVYRALPGESGGLGGNIYLPVLGIENGQYICPEPDRCRLRIEHIRCHYPAPTPCSKLACRAGCGSLAIACNYNCDVGGGSVKAKALCKALCGTGALICVLGCEGCSDP